ncbi:hypothetical protein ILYODFUR_003975 [Ilyodon furcidens]|uniref:Uncharacterized protein n=1 Tax=Ilyodon furcidens TaxID=33524 RepID=A0ABV0TS54_9TELE
MCSLSYSRLENWLRVPLLRCLSLLDEVSKGALTMNISLFFYKESATGSVLLCSFCVSALFSQTPSWSSQMAAHTEPGSAGGFFLLKGRFPFHCRYMLIQEELMQSLTRCNLLGFLR